jgi:hypothetical protein
MEVVDVLDSSEDEQVEALLKHPNDKASTSRGKAPARGDDDDVEEEEEEEDDDDSDLENGVRLAPRNDGFVRIRYVVLGRSA